MDDYGNEIEFQSDDVLMLTPKGYLGALLSLEGIDLDDFDEIWAQFEAFCIKVSGDRDAEYPALVFDGEGGQAIGVNLVEPNDD